MLAWALLLCAPVEIEVSATVAPLSRLLPQLGAQSGMALIAGASVRHDVMAIASPKRPIRELMDGIAEAANAEWIENKGEWVLTRSKRHEDADQAQEYRFRLARISDYLRQIEPEKPFTEAQASALAERRENFYKDDQPFQARQDLHNRSPLARFGTRLANSIGADTLAKIPPWRTVVFSTKPTARQKPLPADAVASAVSTFAQEQALYAKAIDQRTSKFYGDGSTNGFDHIAPASYSPGKVLVIATARQFGLISFAILVANPQGEIMLRTQTDIRPRSSTGVLEAVEKGNNQPIEHVGWLAELRKPGPLAAELLGRLRMPQENEPHAIFCEAGVRTWSKVKDKPVIALVPDLFPPLGPAEEGSTATPLTSFEVAIRLRCGVEHKPDRIVIRPNEPVLARTMRSDRAAMQAFYKEGEFPRLQAIVEFIKSSTLAQAEFAQRYAAAYDLPSLPSTPLLPLVRLLALGPNLLPSGSLTFGQMSQVQKEFARYLVYETRDWYSRDPEAKGTLLSEPTEAFPTDLPSDARLMVQSRAEAGAAYSSYRSWTPVRFEDVSELAYEPGEQRTYRMGEFRHYTITFTAPGIPEKRVLLSDVLSLSKEELNFDRLPGEYRQALRERIDGARRKLGWPPLP